MASLRLRRPSLQQLLLLETRVCATIASGHSDGDSISHTLTHNIVENLLAQGGPKRWSSSAGGNSSHDAQPLVEQSIRTLDGLPLPRYIPPRVRPERHRQPLPLLEAIQEMKETDPSQRKQRKFDETVEVALNTSVDPRRGDQMVRGMASLPHGTGKKVRVCVFTVQDVALGAAREAGADVIGDDALISKIQQDGSSAINFDACLATPDMMSKLGKIARILGPRGLMPNPKLGTVTQDVAAGVVAMKQGRVEFRADKGAIIHGGVGKKSFSVEALQENIEAFVRSVVEARPKAIKGQGIPGYILKMTLSTTMGPSVPVALSSLEK
ncbi:hypothetical protein M9434_005427 [Picochlorum sp. BPE23]|nr:hypothetical protein M9434_005427 [Picochlorum sp. BPE23]